MWHIMQKGRRKIYLGRKYARFIQVENVLELFRLKMLLYLSTDDVLGVFACVVVVVVVVAVVLGF